MKNKQTNGTNHQDEIQEIRSILESISKDIGKDWEKITSHALFKSKYNTFVNELLPKVLDMVIELEKQFNFEEYNQNPEKFLNQFEPTYKYTPDFDIYRKFDVKEVKTVHQANQFLVGHILSLLKRGGELITYLSLTRPNYDDNSHLKTIINLLSLSVTKSLIKFSNHYRLLSDRDSRTVGGDKILKYHLIEDVVNINNSCIETNTLFLLLIIKNFKQEVFLLTHSLHINQDNWKEVQDSL